LRAITEAKVKTHCLAARTLTRLLAAGLLSGCWLSDEGTRALRKRLARRAQFVRQRTRCKNQVHAVLMRNLKGRPPMTDAFGKRGRGGSPSSTWLTTSARPWPSRRAGRSGRLLWGEARRVRAVAAADGHRRRV
jgi:hypothetical protein